MTIGTPATFLVFLLGITVAIMLTYRDKTAWRLYAVFATWCGFGLACLIAGGRLT